ncbi:MAG: acyl carrier protein [Lachnospiraceae bacterium]|jgi:acyl carrier protein|nr:acyl carrier protein [Lachnospiraceae bacterium]MCH4064873.1 acyl carrier protein [Lachnospiraceae bacterium]MCH4103849.1 acyl carrier protein [Lachnospiraceae bacterium]MCI1308167.1 acyl carrier protein [Lachnospiraceae bacterium]MCI1333042.1 acyl carrier protein [Lachnospiraceae bacterium]
MNTQEKVIDIIKDTLKFDDKEITPQMDLFKDLGVDSLDAVELVMALEEAFGVQIPDEELPKLNTVETITKYIEAHKA